MSNQHETTNCDRFCHVTSMLAKKKTVQGLLSDKFDKICVLLALQLCCGASHSAENAHHLTWVSIERKSEYKAKTKNMMCCCSKKCRHNAGTTIWTYLNCVFQPVWVEHLLRFSATAILQWFCVHLAKSGCNNCNTSLSWSVLAKLHNHLTQWKIQTLNQGKICLMRRQMDISYHGSSTQQMKFISCKIHKVIVQTNDIWNNTNEMKCLG